MAHSVDPRAFRAAGSAICNTNVATWY